MRSDPEERVSPTFADCPGLDTKIVERVGSRRAWPEHAGIPEASLGGVVVNESKTNGGIPDQMAAGLLLAAQVHAKGSMNQQPSVAHSATRLLVFQLGGAE